MGGTDISNDGCIDPKSRAFYELRAKGGAGTVTISECMVHPTTDGSHAYHLDPSILNSLANATYAADAIRRHGAIPSLELSHSGMFAGTYMTDKSKQKSMNQWGPCDTVRADGVQVKALSKDMIDEIVEAYKNVAGMAKRAGFEMLMIHGGHGWLINQFLSPLFNHRTDEYGGSLENRCRLAIEVLKAVREAVGPFFPIEFRMSGSEFVEDGYGLEEGIKIAKMIEPYCDIIHVSAGTYQKTFGIIKTGKANIVYMGRALLADSFLPRKVMANKDEDIVKCLRCFTCMAERAATSTRRCTVNPLIGREDEGDEIQPAPIKKKVLVAGAGPGGLYAAYTAARRGHQVILCEKSDEVGVFGGGLAGCECAIHLGMEGKKVHIVEMRDELAPDANVRHRPLMLKEIDKYATVHTGYKGLEVRSDGVLCEDKEGNQVLVPGTTTICALGQRSNTKDVEALRDSAEYVAIIGDASRVSTITNAVYWGYHAALDI